MHGAGIAMCLSDWLRRRHTYLDGHGVRGGVVAVLFVQPALAHVAKSAFAYGVQDGNALQHMAVTGNSVEVGRVSGGMNSEYNGIEYK